MPLPVTAGAGGAGAAQPPTINATDSENAAARQTRTTLLRKGDPEFCIPALLRTSHREPKGSAATGFAQRPDLDIAFGSGARRLGDKAHHLFQVLRLYDGEAGKWKVRLRE